MGPFDYSNRYSNESTDSLIETRESYYQTARSTDNHVSDDQSRAAQSEVDSISREIDSRK